MRRNIGRHADRDAASAIDQQIGEARRQDRRLLLLAVVIGLEIDGVGIDILDQSQGRPREARFGVAHGRRAVAVHRAEIALAVDQREAHREGLRHAHQGVIDRGVAMGMVFTHHLADDARRFHIGAVGQEIVFLRRMEDAPMHRFQAVAHVRQGAAHDHAHRISEIGAFHLLGDRNRTDVGGRRNRRVVVLVGQNALAGWWAEIVFFLGDSPAKGQFRRLAGLRYEKKATTPICYRMFFHPAPGRTGESFSAARRRLAKACAPAYIE